MKFLVIVVICPHCLLFASYVQLFLLFSTLLQVVVFVLDTSFVVWFVLCKCFNEL